MPGSFYRHTQRAPLYRVLLAVAAGSGLAATALSLEPLLRAALAGIAALFALLGLSFRELTVEDQGDWLLIRYGPLPLFRKRFRYSAMTAVQAGRRSVLDGLGIHYVPGRGWIYNLWGADCVLIDFGKRRVRIGSDDAQALTAFLRRKLGRTP